MSVNETFSCEIEDCEAEFDNPYSLFQHSVSKHGFGQGKHIVTRDDIAQKLKETRQKMTEVWRKNAKKNLVPFVKKISEEGKSMGGEGLSKERMREVQKIRIERIRGKSYEEIYGEEKAKKIKENLSEVRTGTYEELYGEKKAKEVKEKKSKRMSERYSGVTWVERYGKEKAEELKKKRREQMIERLDSLPNVEFPEELDHLVRSSWEEEMGNLLKDNGFEYEYEPFHIKYGGGKTYIPDFVISGSIIVEVKGYCPSEVKDKLSKISDFEEYFLIVVGGGDDLSSFSNKWFPWEEKENLLGFLEGKIEGVTVQLAGEGRNREF